MNKFLVITLTILFFIIVGESGYYFVILSQKGLLSPQIISNNTGPRVNYDSTRTYSNAISEKSAKKLTLLPKNITKRVDVIIEVNGILVDIIDYGKNPKYDDNFSNYIVKDFKIKDIKSNEIDYWNITQDILDTANFYRRKGDSIVPINFSDIQIGDKISINVDVNFIYDQSNSYKFTVENDSK